jgi:hypothetical protein
VRNLLLRSRPVCTLTGSDESAMNCGSGTPFRCPGTRVGREPEMPVNGGGAVKKSESPPSLLAAYYPAEALDN